MTKILIVDDNATVCAALQWLFRAHDFETVVAHAPAEALDVLAREAIAVVIQDMNFSRDTTSGKEGVELMRAIRRLDPDMPVVLMTAYTELSTAVQMVKEGASDYLAKPWDDEKLLATVRNLTLLRSLADENSFRRHERERARDGLSSTADLCGLVYESLAMHEVASLAVRIASSDLPVLILGPNGAGKEKIAEIVQANSRRKAKPFVRVNAGGLPDQLLEAELFGMEAGAYTGATRARAGRFEEAHGGTLFLDEIGNLSMTGQMKLLRVLQTGEFQRLGSNQTRRADVRVLSATNVDLKRAIAAGAFREDLYFRLNVIELTLPPLRDRAGDITMMAEHFLREASPTRALSLTSEAREQLLGHDWPGNVRELENRVRRAAVVARTGWVTPADLGFVGAASSPTVTTQGADAAAVDSERAELESALREADGVILKAAALLGISRQALYRRMQRAGLVLERRFKS